MAAGHEAITHPGLEASPTFWPILTKLVKIIYISVFVKMWPFTGDNLYPQQSIHKFQASSSKKISIYNFSFTTINII